MARKIKRQGPAVRISRTSGFSPQWIHARKCRASCEATLPRWIEGCGHSVCRRCWAVRVGKMA